LTASRQGGEAPPAPAAFRYSVVIPVFNSERLIGETVRRTAEFFERAGWRHQIVLVNDGSADRSWEVVAALARQNASIVAINLEKNYGQYAAIFCGLHHASGDFVVTMDDDLQNPPEEIAQLVAKILEGYDVVFGRFRAKQHARYRRWGSGLIGRLNRWIFGQPRDLTVSNFRIIRKSVVDRMRRHRTRFPYITGLALLYSEKRANVWVEHRPRPQGESNYDLILLFRTAARIVLHYAPFPGAGIIRRIRRNPEAPAYVEKEVITSAQSPF